MTDTNGAEETLLAALATMGIVPIGAPIERDDADTLPVGSMIMDSDDDLWFRFESGWKCITGESDEGDPWDWAADASGQMVVLHRPDVQGDT